MDRCATCGQEAIPAYTSPAELRQTVIRSLRRQMVRNSDYVRRMREEIEVVEKASVAIASEVVDRLADGRLTAEEATADE